MRAIPDGFSTITPFLALKNAHEAIALYERAFGAKEVHKMLCPSGSGKIMHACLQIGSSRIFLSEANPEKGCMPTTSSFYVYVDDVDTACRRAKQAGVKETMPLQDQFWGDRAGSFEDTFGNRWTLASHVRDISDQEIQEAAKKMAAKAA